MKSVSDKKTGTVISKFQNNLQDNHKMDYSNRSNISNYAHDLSTRETNSNMRKINIINNNKTKERSITPLTDNNNKQPTHHVNHSMVMQNNYDKNKLTKIENNKININDTSTSQNSRIGNAYYNNGMYPSFFKC